MKAGKLNIKHLRIAFPRPLCYNLMYCGDEQEE